MRPLTSAALAAAVAGLTAAAVA
ncbi:MAG: hypothetical protein JWP17_913, partial [Solirubrobacterales bacterium]|nr:hypothetical protein [Solirubrobacterales bacterium]